MNIPSFLSLLVFWLKLSKAFAAHVVPLTESEAKNMIEIVENGVSSTLNFFRLQR